MLTLIGATVLTSCIDKRGDRLTSMLTIKSSQDLIDVCDIEITYKGKGGVNMVDTITTTKWNKIVINDSFPTKIGMVAVRYLVKPGFKPTKETYNLECEYKLTLREQDEYEHTMGYFPITLPDVPGDKVASFLELKNFQNRHMVEDEERSDVENAGVLIATKAEYDPYGNRPFDVKYKWQMNDSNTVQLVEEKPVEGPDLVKKEVPDAADHK